MQRHKAFADEMRSCDALASSLPADRVEEACVSLGYLLVGLDHAQQFVRVLPEIRSGEELATPILPLPPPWSIPPYPLR